MLFTVRNKIFGGLTAKNLQIVKDEKYGIVNQIDNSYLIPKEYDNIFLYGVNTYVLHKNGKIGLCRIDEENGRFKPVIICECEYDVIDSVNHNLYFSNDNIIRCYNSYTKQTRDFKEVSVYSPYLYACDETYQYVIYEETGELIFKKKYTDYSKSCYAYCGNTDKGAVFYDARYSTYLYPTDKGYKIYKHLFNNPIIINRNNVINIVESDNGMGVIDSFGNSIIDNEFKEIRLELKVTAISKDNKTEKTVVFPDNIYNSDTVKDIGEWI